MRLRRVGFLVAAAGLLAAVHAAAQSWPAAPPPALLPPPLTITIADGAVDLVRGGRVEAARAPDVLDEGERLVTNAGRVELVFADGAMAHVDRDTDLRIDPGVVLRLVRGRAILRTPAGDDGLTVVTPAGEVLLEPRGAYDLAAHDLAGDTEVSVHAGRAVLRAGDRDVAVAPGSALLVHPRDLVPRWARPRPPDAFDAWAQALADDAERARTPALPAEIQPWAGDLASHGRWSSLAPYGPVWFPAAGPAWRPFGAGAWRYTRYGWTWIDADRWTWPLHHYGRWGHHDVRGWYWIPHRQWGPAWVGWAVAADHVAWAPLGWNARPLVDFSVGARTGPTGLWASSWSIVPRRHFLDGGAIRGRFEDPRRLPGPVLGGFVSQLIGPRGPAQERDRFAVRPDRPARWRESPRPDTLAVPQGADPAPAARPAPEPPSMAAAPVHRPVDAPPRWRDDGGTSPIARPLDRVWSTDPSAQAPAGRRRVPVGPPIRPGTAPDGASSGARRGAAPSDDAPSADRGRSGRRGGADAARGAPGPAGTESGAHGAGQPAKGGRSGTGATGGGRRGDGRGSGATSAGGSRRRPG